ncbi:MULTISPECIES: Pr6Pr family membrane protein [unclassified Rhizobium]|uniref:Pr6Pr family membrane protein n=1 Tax=unclassified Rhizobium TaxID=2613769 RepID=UPI0038029E5B
MSIRGSVRFCRCGLALLALTGIVISYVAIIPGAHVSRMRLTTNFLSYFTIQSNILLVVTLLSAEIAPSSPIGRWARRATTRTAVFLYVGVAGGVYLWMLRDVWHPRGWQLRGDQLLHYCIPLLVALDWIFLVERARLSWKDAIWWLCFPALYSVYSLVHGYFSGFYPYPFLDVNDIGLQAVLANMALLAALFLLLGGALILIDHIAAKVGKGMPQA